MDMERAFRMTAKAIAEEQHGPAVTDNRLQALYVAPAIYDAHKKVMGDMWTDTLRGIAIIRDENLQEGTIIKVFRE